MTSSRHAEEARRNNFDLLRLFAALQVLVFHSLGLLELGVPAWLSPLQFFPGVSIFFFVSGFLVSGSLQRNASLKTYARNRVLRIFPGLWVCLAVTVFIASLFGYSFARPDAALWFVAQMMGLHYTPDFLSSFGIGSYNGSLWTIPVELQFYVVLPVVFAIGFAFKNLRLVVVAGFFLSFLLAAISYRLFPDMLSSDESVAAKLLRYSFLPHVYLFAFGVVFRLFGLEQSPWIRGKFLPWLGSFLLVSWLLAATGLEVVEELHLGRMLLLGVVALSAAYTFPTMGEKLLHGNDISFGIYIYHVVIINALVELRWPVGQPLALAVVVIVTGVLAYLSWVLVERPSLQWARSRRALLAA